MRKNVSKFCIRYCSTPTKGFSIETPGSKSPLNSVNVRSLSSVALSTCMIVWDAWVVSLFSRRAVSGHFELKLSLLETDMFPPMDRGKLDTDGLSLVVVNFTRTGLWHEGIW